MKLGYVCVFEGVECKLSHKGQLGPEGQELRPSLCLVQVEEAGPPLGKLSIEAVELTWFDPMDKGRISMKDAFSFEPGSAWHSGSFNCHGESVRLCVLGISKRGWAGSYVGGQD